MNITDGSHRTKYYLSGDAVTLEDNGTDKIYYTYDADGDLISMNLNGKEYFYIRNVQNDVIGLHDSEGNVVVRYIYDTWGKIMDISGSLKDSVGKKNPYRYRGYRYDEETGLYYLQSRYYNAEWGRFINSDAIVGQVGDILSFNMFAYCGNNPVIMEDPNGYRFDITGGRDNGKYISMAIQSQYPAIKKNVERKQAKSIVNNFVKETVKSIGDSKIGEKLSEKAKPKKVVQYSNKKGMYGLHCEYTKTPPVMTALNKVSNAAGLIGTVTSAFSIGKNMYEGNYIGVTTGVLNFVAGIGIGALIGLAGITGGWAIGLSVGGGFIAGFIIDCVVDKGIDTINYIKNKRE